MRKHLVTQMPVSEPTFPMLIAKAPIIPALCVAGANTATRYPLQQLRGRGDREVV